ncbi:MAG: hypothetical protein A2534_01110 [Candidatus Magasanikbacteria bacterium RIFOXYD2_FULL_39_9]|uniref:Uncharacterized protein n=1 Tax=Candidatus Magasanikbacteria bacterium RIFOXYD1_FULL_40_23 TaxID=1798705 RepID=A0A1F6PAR5_9BACT|nr:MAG: hypothetical protein A2534_01110 [Candidatus Magasanikbacteria bacterium RIFOXYD2_FULL_39_9]OGH93275.1 MAG: hypothetical protein A2563_01570 [Candidatus Magasanikbacteria bacterium RIFOXYD1_FULL_40_23]
MKKKSEFQKLIDELSDSLSSLGEELTYWTIAFLQSLGKEFNQWLEDFFTSMTGGFTPSMEFDLNDITEEDIACRRYGPQKVRVPR